MNFNFEGNYKPRRNINLGGVKTVGDKKSLLLKAQNERKAREQERIKHKSVQHIQAFYRGRRQAFLVRQEIRAQFKKLLDEFKAQSSSQDQVNSMLTLTRALILFYQPEKDKKDYLKPYVKLLIQKETSLLQKMFMTASWTWLVRFLIKKVLLESLDDVDCCCLLASFFDSSLYPTSSDYVDMILFNLQHTQLLYYVRKRTVCSKESASILEPIYVECIKASHSSELLRVITLDLFTEPFLLDHLSHQVALKILTYLPFNEWLCTIIDLGKSGYLKHDLAVAGLLMNVTEMCNIEQGKCLDEGNRLINYTKATQLLLSQLPVEYLADSISNHSQHSIDQDSSDSDSEDVEMTEVVKTLYVSPELRERLESLYDMERINTILSKCMQLTTLGTEAIRSLSSFINTLLLRWPMKKSTILNTLSYKSLTMHHLMQTLWQSWSSSKEAKLFGRFVMYQLNEAESLFTGADASESWSILYLLCEIYTRLLLTIADNELLGDESEHHPFKRDQLIELSTQLKNISFVMFWKANNMSLSGEISHSGIQLSQLRSTVTHLLQQIHMRDSRRSFCPTDHWLIPDLNTDNFSSTAVAEEFNLETEQETRPQPLSKGRLAIISPRLGILNNIPFVVPFEQRVEIFRQFIQNDRRRNVDERYGARVSATIRRNHIFEDGFNAFHKLESALKDKVAISFVDEFGLEEAGIDGGGVFKEFLTGLSHDAFNVNYGLFVATPEQLLYPNPNSFATEPLQLEYFRFLGLIIGKAVYEGILLDVPFASFFLKKCLGKVNYLDDLSSLDPELYRGLLTLKNYDGNVEDLSLDFTITHDELGKSKTVELIPNGSQIAVTNQNRIQYIYLVANYRLNIQIAKQCRAFFKGLSTIVDIKWLRMFNEQELQVLLGGASIPIDLDDLRANTVLAGYMEHDATVQNFWKVLESFDNTLRMKFVKFVTSCSRPPLLGFKELVPKFCIRNAGVDDERLPTSSTCVNLLKLPNFSSFERLKDKLLYAITADAGFDLS
ncbi:hypothetical protein G6F46_003782 [Rhizopus delemar]|uniref:HECT-type E3 ubiquitin transferase n=2 Tax=Rhizopus TaxID=4842 RepID=A0A9P6Z0A8_9FUNG|nr:hypothetical protein G6F55_006483 [Rhizopus delemar]KAG1551966.1 hypothetical protein G6F51_001509 [Rhizopus arrhizus]KAG1504307.1 hypothetical protein G6F54_001094 [Rhizopus delemar]KAG1514049.1 hypothetical protein G6F53_003971 [Rhizopus delemar]KAG1520263.1 hypothetical protein G6F52_007829 [Rhizopus delemar]